MTNCKLCVSSDRFDIDVDIVVAIMAPPVFDHIFDVTDNDGLDVLVEDGFGIEIDVDLLFMMLVIQFL